MGWIRTWLLYKTTIQGLSFHFIKAITRRPIKCAIALFKWFCVVRVVFRRKGASIYVFLRHTYSIILHICICNGSWHKRSSLFGLFDYFGRKGQICALRSLYEGVGLISCLEILRYFNNIHITIDQEHIKFTYDDKFCKSYTPHFGWKNCSSSNYANRHIIER